MIFDVILINSIIAKVKMHLLSHWRFYLPVAIILIFALVIFFWWFLGSSPKGQAIDDQNKVDIDKNNIQIEVVEDNRNAIIQNINAVHDESEKANTNFNTILHTDSNQRSGDFSAAKRLWCQDHAGDSRCQ